MTKVPAAATEARPAATNGPAGPPLGPLPPDVRMVPIDDIYRGARRRKELGDLFELARDIRENGLLHFPCVRPPTDTELELGLTERWVLVTGGRRLGAVQGLGWNEIPVQILDSKSELQHRILELHENIKRKQLTWQEESFMQQEIVKLREAQAQIEGKTVTKAQVALELGVDPTTLYRGVQAAEAMQKNPGLKKASSRKAALRAAEMEKHAERLSVQQVIAEQDKQLHQHLQDVIVTADAREWIRKQESKSVNLVLTDPQWGIDYFTMGHKARSAGHGEYDDSEEAARDFLTDMVPQWCRVLRETGWLAVFLGEEAYEFTKQLVENCCVEHIDYRSIGEHRCHVAKKEKSDGCRYVRVETKAWLWLRPNSLNKPRYPELHAQNLYERILVVNMGKARLNYACSNVLSFDAEYGDDRIHPNQKSITLAKEIIRRTCNIGDTVVDTSFGSGALLAGAASAAMLVAGCDTNATMRGPAIGMIMKHRIPTPARAKQISEDRYYQQLGKMVVGTEDFTEVEPEEAAT